MCRELRAKDLERLTNFIDDLKSKEKRGLTKEQKEDLVCAQKVKDFLETGVDVRCEQRPLAGMNHFSDLLYLQNDMDCMQDSGCVAP